MSPQTPPPLAIMGWAIRVSYRDFLLDTGSDGDDSQGGYYYSLVSFLVIFGVFRVFRVLGECSQWLM